MTAALPEELLDALRSVGACMADIRALAGKLGDLSPGQIEAELQGLLDTGEDRALSRLLQVCAFNEAKLDPKVLCACIGVCTETLEHLPEHYRIRLGLDYRLIVHWQPGKVLKIVDVIPRQDLASWIRLQG